MACGAATSIIGAAASQSRLRTFSAGCRGDPKPLPPAKLPPASKSSLESSSSLSLTLCWLLGPPSVPGCWLLGDILGEAAREEQERCRRGLEARNEPNALKDEQLDSRLKRAERSGREATERLDRGVGKLLLLLAHCRANGLLLLSSIRSSRGVGEATDLRGVATHSCQSTLQMGMAQAVEC